MKSNVENMLDMFTQIRKVYVNEFGKLFPEENFSPNEIDVLIFLSNNPSINTNRQLSLCLNVSKGLICRSTDSLFRRGLLAVTPDSSDSRIQHLSLTEQADSIIRTFNMPAGNWRRKCCMIFQRKSFCSFRKPPKKSSIVSRKRPKCRKPCKNKKTANDESLITAVSLHYKLHRYLTCAESTE